MNERKTIFNATFEESQNFVTPKYIEHCFKESDNGVISKRTFGVFISSAILGLFAFLLSYVEKNSPYGYYPFSSYLNILWYGLAIAIPIYYMSQLIRFHQKKILNAYLFNRTMFMIYFTLCLLVYLFMSNLARIIFNYNLLLLFYSLLYIYFVINRLLKINKNVYSSLYHQKKSPNKVLVYYEKFEQFAKKYGFIVVLGLFIFRQCSSNQNEVKNDLTQQIAVFFAPFLVFIAVYFIFSILEAHIEGYYLNKYSEEYRKKYGYSEFEWSEGDN